MKIYGKITLLAIGVAAVSSALTALAVNSIQNNSTGNGLASVSENPIQRRGALYTASHTVTPPTDFTSAAESTVNGVVSIKSYATPRSRGSYGNNGGGYYIDRLNSSSAHLKAEAGARHRASSNSRARSNREVSGRE